MHMRASLIAIGNSRGIRIPKTPLTQLQLENEVELSVEEEALVVRPVRHRREGWQQAMAQAGAWSLLDPETTTTFDETEWQW